MENLIEVSGLHKRFGNLVAVDGVDLTVRRGEVLGFLGPNGAGKSTTMKMITGYLTPTDGEIAVCGHDVLAEPIAAKSNMGYLPEGAPAYGEMTATTFLDFIADIRGLRGHHKEQRIRYAVEQIHLEGVLDQPIETLSKGYKRRVGLAQAVLHDPEVLILDEPTDGLDPNQKHEVRTLIKELAEKKAIVISTHILEEVDAVCSRALIIAHGKVVFSGTPAELAAESRYHNAVTLTVNQQGRGDLRGRLGALECVAAVEVTTLDDERVRMTVVPTNKQNISGAVHQCLHEGDWQADELFIEAGRLDEVFRSITVKADEAGEVART